MRALRIKVATLLTAVLAIAGAAPALATTDMSANCDPCPWDCEVLFSPQVCERREEVLDVVRPWINAVPTTPEEIAALVDWAYNEAKCTVDPTQCGI